jgi:hypothetical protein
MKPGKLSSLAVVTALCSSLAAGAQTACFSFSPNVRINTTTGAVSQFSTSGADIQSCYPGTTTGGGFAPNTVANSLYGYTAPNFAPVAAQYQVFSICGIYNGAGATAGSGQSYDANAFAMPGRCNRLFTVQSVIGHGPSPSMLVLHEFDVSNPASVTEVGTPVVISSSYGGDVPLAISPLLSNGTRKIYMGVYNGIVSWTLDANANVIAGPVTEYTTGTYWTIDNNCRMEVTPDGNRVLFSTRDNELQILSGGTVSTIAGGAEIFSGFEMLPASQSPNGHELVFYSSHNRTTGAGSLRYVDMTTLSSVNVGGGTPAAFGYTDIERARNGKLYLAYNPGFGMPTGSVYNLSTNPGWLYMIDPATMSPAPVMNGTSYISINSYTLHRYTIQNQIDGENYDFISSRPGIQSLNINGASDFYTRYALMQAHDPYHLRAITVWNCNGVLNLNALVKDAYNSYYVKLETGIKTLTPDGFGGYYEGFAPNATYAHGPIFSSPANNTLNLTSTFSALANYNGLFQVTYVINGACGTDTVRQLFDLKKASVLVNFMMAAPNGCPAQSPYQSLTFPTLAQPVTGVTPPCVNGWLGANSCGITSAGWSASATNTSIVGNPSLRVDQVDATTGAFIKNIFVDNNLAFTSSAYLFNNGYSLGYFNQNYGQMDNIKNNFVFKVTAAVNTQDCGLISNYSYFKIIDGGPQYGSGNWWRSGKEGTEQALAAVHVFPNPATNQVHVSWLIAEQPTNARITLVDALGRAVLQQQFTEAQGSNEQVVQIEQLAAGMYHYTLATSAGQYTGKLVKQ